MPKERKNRHDLYQSWIDSDPDLYRDLRLDMQIRGNDLFCTFCGRTINCLDKSRVTRHVKSHASSSSRLNNPLFFYELTKAFVASGIPLDKLTDPALRDFLETYMERKLPHTSTLRNTYVNHVYNDIVQGIRKDLANNFVYFIIDETTDACGRVVLNFLIGRLQSDSASASHLLASKVLDETNPETIIQFVNECFGCVWPNQDNSNKVLVMLTDAASYMITAGKILSHKYSYMVHFTCAVQALHRVVETIKDSFPLLNKLISNINKIFVKAPTRRDLFREILGGIPLPPEPVVTQWGNWLTIVAYYDQHFENVKSVIDRFGLSESTGIGIVQNLMEDRGICEDIRYINSNYSILISAIQKLETRGLSLCDQFQILHDVQNKLNVIATSSISTRIKNKFLQVFQKNPGYHIFEHICNCLDGTYQALPSAIVPYRSCINNFAYCPVSSVDVERTYLLHKLILGDRRRNFTAANLEKMLTIIYEYRHTKDDS